MKLSYYIFTSIVLMFSAGFTYYSPKEDKQKQLYYYKSDLISYELKITEWNKIIAELKIRQSDIESRIKILSGLIENIKSVDNKNNILKQEAEFISRNERLDKLKNEFKKRMLWLYKKGPEYNYQILFTSDSPAKFYARLEYLNKLTEKRKIDFARIKYEEIAYEESKKIKGFRKSDLIRFINKKEEDQTNLLLEKMNIEDSLKLLKTDVDNLLYQYGKLKPMMTALENTLFTTVEESAFELKTVPDYKYKSFADLKGQLIFPVNSTNIINDFGKSIEHNTGTVINNEGIDVSIAENSEVRCVADGTIENVINIPLYRKIIIIKHDEGFRTVYGIVKDIRVNINETVNAGEIIAVTSQNLDGQAFHFEIRKRTIPEDPKNWVTRVKQVL